MNVQYFQAYYLFCCYYGKELINKELLVKTLLKCIIICLPEYIVMKTKYVIVWLYEILDKFKYLVDALVFNFDLVNY